MSNLQVSTAAPCIVCASLNLVRVLEISDVPADTIRLWPSQAAARSARKARMELTFCENCGHLFNRCYDDELVDYEADYDNSQMFSPRFRRYAEELSDRLITTYGLRQKDIVEIGGGRGDFLHIICDRGDNRGVSFGPSYRPSPGDDVPQNVRFVTDYYTAKYADRPADLIVCRHVLEHFWEPRPLIDTVRQAVGERSGLVVYFEVPNGEFVLREQTFWEFIYQHPSYFTQTSLARLFTMCGFQVRNIEESFGGQFLAIEATAPEEGGAPNGYSFRENMSNIAALARALDTAFSTRAATWRNRLQQMRDKGQSVIAWGAGAKATTFLNIVDPAGSVISRVVDINPRKTGRFVPGTGHEIVAPNAVRELRPDVVILMNEIYRDEIAADVAALGLNPTFLVA